MIHSEPALNSAEFQRLVDFYNDTASPSATPSTSFSPTFVAEAKDSSLFLDWQIYVAVAPLIWPDRYPVDNYSLAGAQGILYELAHAYFTAQEDKFEPTAEYHPHNYQPFSYAEITNRVYVIRTFWNLCKNLSPSPISGSAPYPYQILLALVLEVQKAQLSVPSKIKDADSKLDLLFRRSLVLDDTDLAIASHILSLPHCPYSVYERTVNMLMEDHPLSLDASILSSVWDKLFVSLLNNPAVPLSILEDFRNILEESKERLSAAVGATRISLFTKFTNFICSPAVVRKRKDKGE
jgi:hypothetical protein